MTGLVGEAKLLRMYERADRQLTAGGRGISLLEAVYERHVKSVYTLCLRLLAGAREAEDATAHAFVRFGLEATPRRDEAHASRRLRELATDEALRRLRGRRVERVVGRAAEKGSPPAPHAGPPPTTHGGPASPPAPLDSATLDALAARLPDDLRAAFVLHDREGLSALAVAGHLHVEEADARLLIRDARLALRRLWLSLKKEKHIL